MGIVWLLYLAIDGMVSLKDLLKGKKKEIFWKFFYGFSLVICAWCWIQCVLDLVGVPREYSLMCAGCTYSMFGFPHPNGLAIEPQFMGNLLLAPALMAGWMWLRKNKSKNLKLERSRLLLLYFFIISATLFLTFSRGAIYAFVVGMVVMTGWELVIVWKQKERRQRMKRALLICGVMVGSFLFTLNMQGVMAAVSPTNDTYKTGVAKVLNHLTLGIVDVRGLENGTITDIEVVENSVENSDDNRDIDVNVEDNTNQMSEISNREAAFDGYVIESTDTRLRLSGFAFKVWHQDLKTVLFGVGLGGAGQALYVNELSPAPKEIVQNQYVSLLLETGVVGVGLCLLTIIMVVRIFWCSTLKVGLICLMLAYGVSLVFFSGLPNALHIYLLPAVLCAIGTVKKNN